MKYVECSGCSENLGFEGENFERLECPKCGVLNWSFDYDPSKYKDYDGSQKISVVEEKKKLDEGIESTSQRTAGTEFYLSIFLWIVFIIGIFTIYPDYQYWQEKQRGYYGTDAFSGLKYFMSSTSDGAFWVYGLGAALLGAVISTFAHFNQSPSKVESTVSNEQVPEETVIEDSKEPSEQIRKLAKLRDDGILTEEEFEAKKKELLGRM